MAGFGNVGLLGTVGSDARGMSLVKVRALKVTEKASGESCMACAGLFRVRVFRS